jgi:pimeloyl-ACP methyl ester carboxylesterase
MAVVDLSVRELGDGPPLVLLHAFPLSARLFDPLVEHLDGWRILAPDLRGFGRSPLGDDAPTVTAMADDVLAVLDRFGLDRVVLGGVSMGGYVAMEMLRRHPDRLSGVLLVDTKAGADSVPARQGRLATAEAVTAQGTQVLAPLVEVLLGDTTRRERPAVVAEVRGWLDEVEPAAVAWAQRAMADRPESFSTLRDSAVPRAVVVGDEDTLSPVSEAEAMAAEREGTQVFVVPGCGHLAVLEDPPAAAAAVREALAGL